MKRITDVHIDNVRLDSKGKLVSYSAGFTCGAFRYHAWVDATKPNPKTSFEWVHKNPVVPPDRYARSQHRTISPTAFANAWMMTEMWAVIEREDLVAKAVEAQKFYEMVEEAESENTERDELKRNAAPALYHALKELLTGIEFYHQLDAQQGLLRNHTLLARAALVAAQPQGEGKI